MEEIDLTAQDEITLFTDEEQVKVDHVNEEFHQESKLKGIIREFTVFNDSQCYQSVTRKHGGKVKFRVNLTYLDSKPRRFFTLATGWLVTAIICSILSFLLIYLGWFSEIRLNPGVVMIMTALSITLSVIALLFALLKTQDRVIYYSRFGHIPILELINNKPNRQAFSTFMDFLSAQIIQARQNSHLDTTERLTMELKELRRLKDEGVIPESHYEQAKKRIFRNQAFKS